MYTPSRKRARNGRSSPTPRPSKYAKTVQTMNDEELEGSKSSEGLANIMDLQSELKNLSGYYRQILEDSEHVNEESSVTQTEYLVSPGGSFDRQVPHSSRITEPLQAKASYPTPFDVRSTNNKTFVSPRGSPYRRMPRQNVTPDPQEFAAQDPEDNYLVPPGGSPNRRPMRRAGPTEPSRISTDVPKHNLANHGTYYRFLQQTTMHPDPAVPTITVEDGESQKQIFGRNLRDPDLCLKRINTDCILSETDIREFNYALNQAQGLSTKQVMERGVYRKAAELCHSRDWGYCFKPSWRGSWELDVISKRWNLAKWGFENNNNNNNNNDHLNQRQQNAGVENEAANDGKRSRMGAAVPRRRRILALLFNYENRDSGDMFKKRKAPPE